MIVLGYLTQLKAELESTNASGDFHPIISCENLKGKF